MLVRDHLDGFAIKVRHLGAAARRFLVPLLLVPLAPLPAIGTDHARDPDFGEIRMTAEPPMPVESRDVYQTVENPYPDTFPLDGERFVLRRNETSTTLARAVSSGDAAAVRQALADAQNPDARIYSERYCMPGRIPAGIEARHPFRFPCGLSYPLLAYAILTHQDEVVEALIADPRIDLDSAIGVLPARGPRAWSVFDPADPPPLAAADSADDVQAETPIYAAAGSDNAHALRLLLARGASREAPSWLRLTLPAVAAKHGADSALRVLLEEPGIDPLARSPRTFFYPETWGDGESDWTPLMLAVRFAHPSTVELLLADPRARRSAGARSGTFPWRTARGIAMRLRSLARDLPSDPIAIGPGPRRLSRRELVERMDRIVDLLSY